MDGARRVQRRQHSILLSMWRGQRMLRCNFFLDNTLLDEVLIRRVAQGDNATSESMRMVLCLQLHFLLLMHLDGMQAILVQVRRLVRYLLL